jgi:arylsulfatase A-like enzyme
MNNEIRQPRPPASAVRWLRTAAALTVLLPLSACGGTGASPSRSARTSEVSLPSQPDLLLITIDTLRADHLSSWGYPRETSPVIDRLAREGVRFDQAQAQWPKTGPSFASIMTATYPKDNGIVRHVGIPIPCGFRMLAEELSALGYQTRAVVANGAVGSEFYFDQGFDENVETWKHEESDEGLDRREKRRRDPNRAERVTDLALETARRFDRTRPYFLWVHYLDPHAPYSPSGEHADAFQDDDYFEPSQRIEIDRKKARREIGAIGIKDVVDGEDRLAFYVARYDAEIRYTDEQIGRLLTGLGESGLDRNRVTALTADHGESLGEHNYYFSHGRLPFQTCLRVPLLFHWPDVLAPGSDVAPVELIDLAPTLLALAGKELPDDAWAQGVSLVPRLRAQGDNDGLRLAFSEAGYGQDRRWLHVVRDARFKLVYAPLERDQVWIGGEGREFVLFDLVEDPGETRDVAADHPEVLDRLKRALWHWYRTPTFPVASEISTCGEERAMEAETEKLLRSLGYL